MITPSFKLTQNDQFLFIVINAPYAKLSELDIFVVENDFRFYCKPYFLRLNLPGSIIENDEDVVYDFEQNIFKLKYEKKNSGEQFQGLDLLTKLLTPVSEQKTVLIEELPETEAKSKENIAEKQEQTENLDEESNDEDEEIEWYVEQTVNEPDLNLNPSGSKYGFAQTKSNVFSRLNDEYQLVVDLKDPENNKQDRSALRVEDENQKFDDEHYLADYFDDTGLIEDLILKYEPVYEADYTETEIDILKNFPKKTFLLEKEEKFYAFSGLIDILFAYCYNQRINCGENNVESGWTIAKVSSTLSWFDTFKSLEQVLIASYRRILCFPLYRNWKVTELVYNDLIELLKHGQKQIIKSLLDIRKSFLDKVDNRYILNDLYINDYCIWIQYVSNKKLESLISSIENIKVTKEMVNFDLDVLEMCGKLTLENENELDSDSETDSETESESSSDQDSDDGEKEKSEDFGFDLNTLKLGVEKSDNNKPKIIELN